MTFPVLDILPDLLSALKANPIVILQAPPGTGKSTILPLHLIKSHVAADGKLLMLEPRRLAARSVAARMSAQIQETVGETIGYRVRFENRISEKSRIQVVTDGILTRMLQHDPELKEFQLIVFDEFHERSLQADFALALCRQAQEIVRPDLKLLIMSATLDTELLSEAMNGAPVIKAEGKRYPVDIRYLSAPATGPIIPEITRSIERALHQTTGDILVFLPGTSEILRTRDALESLSVNAPVAMHTLFGEQTLSLQQLALEPDRAGKRKIILATSIAETSLTIEGVTVVIDGGLQRLPSYDPKTGLTRLETTRVTRDSADQRAGRAGRTAPGVCFRLWTAAEQHQLIDRRRPEIMEADLTPLVLEAAQWGVHHWKELSWVTPPPNGTWNQARTLLHELDALSGDRISPRGSKMASLPTHPRIAHLLLYAEQQKDSALLELACDLAAILEERDLLDRNQSSDISLRIELLRKWRNGDRVPSDRNALERVEKLSKAWRTFFRISVSNRPPDAVLAGSLLLEAYPDRLARSTDQKSGRYKLISGGVARLQEHDPLLHAEWIVAAHVDAGFSRNASAAEGRIYLAAPLVSEQVISRAKPVRRVFWNNETQQIQAVEEHRIGSLVMQSKPSPEISPQERATIILAKIRENGLRMLDFDDEVVRFLNRIQSARVWNPDDNWPDWSETRLLETLEEWLVPFLTGIKTGTELSRLDWKTILETALGWERLSELNRLLPEKCDVPSGSAIRLNYFPDGRAPVMEVRLQELFGLAESPVVNNQRVRVMLHLLSPGYKPVQVTQDLRNFWNSTYFEVRKELRSRYPKHSWPDDPWTAEAIRGAKKRVPKD